MPPSPTKSKSIHKSSGKLFKHKDRNGSSTVSNSPVNGGSSLAAGTSSNSNSGPGMATIRKDEVIELKDCPLTLPDVNPLDYMKSLPRYAALVNGDGVTMEDLDALQLELELLLSSMLVRQTALTNQIGVIDHLEKGKLPPKMPTSPGKRLRQSDPDKPAKKIKDSSGKSKETNPIPRPPPQSKPPKVICSIVKNEPLFDVPDLGLPEAPKLLPPKNDVTNRFWALVDQYCQEITADDTKLLEDLLNNQTEDAEYYKIPPLGRHYALRWAQEDLMDEQKESSKIECKKKIKTEPGAESCDKFLREVDMNGCNDDVAPLGPLTQRLISGLVEENVLMTENIENKVQGVGIGRPGFIKNLGLGNAASLEKRIKKELQDQGIVEPDTFEDDDDEILSELKRCQSEYRAISSHNHTQLTRLLRLAKEALVRHDLKKKLRDADAKVVEAYKAISSSKQKKKTPLKKDKELAWRALKEREAIVRQLDQICNN